MELEQRRLLPIYIMRLTKEIKGSVKFEKVNFCYPSRPEIKVARNLNIIAREGESIALVGASGCGKSTVVQLLERFYVPNSGVIQDIQV
ncbi:unnamed protein product [Strongylus vulgaris]|uniref:ABC transporter domain-containing protein n=1 Tax=Strongylus vulgaris TaxID=40348 RepID=A0A3P7I4G6_STRVU|nr:unnamed protein product [Strongylus vulgaris]